jgi:hypothetical protein
MKRTLAIVVFTLSQLAMLGFAATIHDNFGPGDTFGTGTVYAFGEAIFSPPTRFIAMPFTPGQTATLGSLTAALAVTSFQDGPPPDAIRIRVLNDVAGLPGSTVLDEFLISNFTFSPISSLTFALYSAAAANQATVFAGVQYWLLPELLTTGSVAHRPHGYWSSNNTNEIGLARDSPGDGALQFDSNNPNGAFRLTGDLAEVPEPGTFILLAPAGMFLALRKRQTSPNGSGRKS